MADEEPKQHWVEQVSPPTFSCTSTSNKIDLNDGTDDATSGKNTKSMPSVYDMVARRVSPHDVAAIKNVYERVWLMTVIEEEEKKKRAGKDSRSTEEKKVSFGKKHLAGVNREDERGPDITAALSGYKLNGEETEEFRVDIENANLWNSDEIKILREVFKSAKVQNNYLKAVLKTNREQLRTLERKYKSQTNYLESRAKKLQEAEKANERLQIASNNFKKQLGSAGRTIELLHEEIKNLRQTQSELSKEAHNLRLELDKERIDRKNSQFDLVRGQQAAFREMELREEKLKLLHEEDTEYLQNQIDSLTKELEKEKNDHQRSLKGLQHLRNHFSSVPLVAHEPDKPKKGNVVNADQLKEWAI